MTYRLTYIYFLLLIGLLACGISETHETEQETKQEATIEDDQLELSTNEAKRSFLEKVLADDRAVRNGQEEARLILEHGYGSTEVYEYRRAQKKQDSINFEAIGSYLELYSYPNKDSLGKDAATTPWLVIHHQTNPGKRKQYFKYLYQAYLDKHIDSRAFEMYLDRTHQYLYRSNFEMGGGSYKYDEKIKLLMEKMKLPH